MRNTIQWGVGPVRRVTSRRSPKPASKPGTTTFSRRGPAASGRDAELTREAVLRIVSAAR